MYNTIKDSLLNLLPDNAKYIGDFHRENEYYFCTIEVSSGEKITFKTNEFEVVSIINDIGVYVTIKISAKYLEYLNSYYRSAKLEAEQILLKFPIQNLSLNASVKKLLGEISILTVGDLVNHSRNDLSKIKYIKEKNIDDIENVISEMGLKLSNK